MLLGENDFKIIKDEITGDVHITVNTQFNKLHADSVTVEENVTARLFGSIKEKLILKKGSRVYLHGKLYGELENLDGEFRCYHS